MINTYSTFIKFIFIVSCFLIHSAHASQISSKILDDIVTGYGKLKQSYINDSPYHIIIIEESHSSLTGQVQIAAILNRLYHRLGLKCLALEGAIKEDEIDFSFFYDSFDKQTNIETALIELYKGEFSGAEFIAMLYNDFQLYPVETQQERNITAPEGQSAVFSFLARMSLLYNLDNYESLTDIQKEKVISLTKLLISNDKIYEEEKLIELIKYSINLSPLTKEAYSEIFSCTYSTKTIDILLKESERFKLNLDYLKNEVEKYIYAYADFVEMADKRSITMAKKVLSIFESKNIYNDIIVMNVGACHTDELIEFFKNSSINNKPLSFSVITSLSELNDKYSINLSPDKYNRKLKGQSVERIYNALYNYPDYSNIIKDIEKILNKYKPSPFSTTPTGRFKIFINRSAAKLSNIMSNVDDITTVQLPNYLVDSSNDYYVDKSSLNFKMINEEKWLFFSIIYRQIPIWIGIQPNQSKNNYTFSENSIEDALNQILENLLKQEGSQLIKNEQIAFSLNSSGFISLESEKLEEIIIQKTKNIKLNQGKINKSSPISMGIGISGFLAVSEQELFRIIDSYASIPYND